MTDAPYSELEIRLLGRFELIRDGEPLDPTSLGRRKNQSLLKLLLSERGRVFTKDELVDQLFADLDPDKAIANLYSRISKLRSVLEPGLSRGNESRFILRSGDGYCFNPDADCWIDTEVFRTTLEQAEEYRQSEQWDQAKHAYREAVALYRGEFLSEDRYEEWTLEPREHWKTLYLQALEQLAACHNKLDEHAAAIDRIQQILDLIPYDEAVFQQLMRYHNDAGEHGAALKAYDRCRHALRTHLGVEPSSTTEKLHKRIQKRHEAGPALSPPNNLPTPWTSFVGRRSEIAHAKRLVSESRLLTLTGIGGSGKTRLALQVASALLAEFDDGVWWAELTPVGQPDLVADAVASTLGLHEASGSSPLETLAAFLAPSSSLLILDNCEHVIGGCVPLVEHLLRTCPALHILTTSREALGVMGEVRLPVPPLAYPDSETLHPKSSQDFPAIELFLERARNHDAGFRLTEENAPAVARICRKLDGLPLGIELAAARLRTSTAIEIDERLDDRFRWLTRGRRGGDPKHRTLEAALDWSWELLSASEQALLRRLSVFRGGGTVDAVEAICSVPPLRSVEILDVLTQLIDKSLVQTRTDQNRTRYTLLETVREYATAQLQEVPDEQRQIRDRHADHYMDFLEHWGALLKTNRQTESLARIDAEIHNIRAAWRQAIDRGDLESLSRNLDFFTIFHDQRPFSQAEQLLSETLTQLEAWMDDGRNASADELALWADLLTKRGLFCFRLGRLEEASSLLQQSIDIARRLEDRMLLATSLTRLGIILHNLGKYRKARQHHDESIRLFRKIGDRWALMSTLMRSGLLLNTLGEYEQAQRRYRESLDIARALDDPRAIAHTLGYMGRNELYLGNASKARGRCRKALSTLEEIGDQFAVALVLAYLAEIECRTDNHESAERFARDSLAIFEELDDQSGIAHALRILGDALYAAGDVRRADASYRKALKISVDTQKLPSLLDALTGLATVYTHQGNAERAMELLVYSVHHEASTAENGARARSLLDDLLRSCDDADSCPDTPTPSPSSLEDLLAEALTEARP